MVKSLFSREHGSEQVNSLGAAGGFLKNNFIFPENPGKLFTCSLKRFFGRFLAKMTFFGSKTLAKYAFFSDVVTTCEYIYVQYALDLIYISEQVNMSKNACSRVFTPVIGLDRFSPKKGVL